MTLSSKVANLNVRYPALLLVPVFCIPQLILYLGFGEILGNILMVGLTMLVAHFALRGFIFARKQSGAARNKQCFHGMVLVIVFLEFALWTSSCFWTDNTVSNPHFWFDFLLSAALPTLVPATKRAVRV
jgi:F0F1-type ATP synthase membrane subunit c/vacuolar-type H+-ATPase subunit K